MSKKNNTVFYLTVLLILCVGGFSIFTYLDKKAKEKSRREVQEWLKKIEEQKANHIIR